MLASITTYADWRFIFIFIFKIAVRIFMGMPQDLAVIV